jgi:hypothetical protein
MHPQIAPMATHARAPLPEVFQLEFEELELGHCRV